MYIKKAAGCKLQFVGWGERCSANSDKAARKERGEIRKQPCRLKLAACSCSGFTLIEMIVITVVVAIVAVALFGVFTTNIARSADPMLRVQAVAIAQGYLDEAMLKAFTDPQGVAGCEANRTLYDDVLDYACIVNQSPQDQFGNTLAGLGAYDVTVTVNAAALLGMHEIIVAVDHGGQTLVTLTGYRANY